MQGPRSWHRVGAAWRWHHNPILDSDPGAGDGFVFVCDLCPGARFEMPRFEMSRLARFLGAHCARAGSIVHSIGWRRTRTGTCEAQHVPPIATRPHPIKGPSCQGSQSHPTTSRAMSPPPGTRPRVHHTVAAPATPEPRPSRPLHRQERPQYLRHALAGARERGSPACGASAGPSRRICSRRGRCSLGQDWLPSRGPEGNKENYELLWLDMRRVCLTSISTSGPVELTSFRSQAILLYLYITRSCTAKAHTSPRHPEGTRPRSSTQTRSASHIEIPLPPPNATPRPHRSPVPPASGSLRRRAGAHISTPFTRRIQPANGAV